MRIPCPWRCESPEWNQNVRMSFAAGLLKGHWRFPHNIPYNWSDLTGYKLRQRSKAWNLLQKKVGKCHIQLASQKKSWGSKGSSLDPGMQHRWAARGKTAFQSCPACLFGPGNITIQGCRNGGAQGHVPHPIFLQTSSCAPSIFSEMIGSN